jgi:hypothetical protein
VISQRALVAFLDVIGIVDSVCDKRRSQVSTEEGCEAIR